MTERKRFEEWVKSNCPDSVSLRVNIDGRYHYDHTNALYEVWSQLQLTKLRLRYEWWLGWAAGVISGIVGIFAGTL